jgi:hypothetical protein
MSKKKTALLQVRCTPAEKAEWEAKADAHGATVSELVRATFSGEPLRTKPIAKRRRDYTSVDPALLRQLAGIANNLNQLAKWANKRGGVDAVETISHLIDLERSVNQLADEMKGAPDADEGI